MKKFIWMVVLWRCIFCGIVVVSWMVWIWCGFVCFNFGWVMGGGWLLFYGLIRRFWLCLIKGILIIWLLWVVFIMVSRVIFIMGLLGRLWGLRVRCIRVLVWMNCGFLMWMVCKRFFCMCRKIWIWLLRIWKCIWLKLVGVWCCCLRVVRWSRLCRVDWRKLLCWCVILWWMWLIWRLL